MLDGYSGPSILLLAAFLAAFLFVQSDPHGTVSSDRMALQSPVSDAGEIVVIASSFPVSFVNGLHLFASVQGSIQVELVSCCALLMVRHSPLLV